VKKIDDNFRSACALGIISCFVLFLTASTPHRVHHLFENLPKPHGHDHHAHPSIQSGTTSAVDHETNAQGTTPKKQPRIGHRMHGTASVFASSHRGAYAASSPVGLAA
jgi:hypothetical protein